MTAVPTVPLRNLAVGQELGSGGQGRVYALKGKGDLVLKTYRTPAALDVHALNELILAPTSGRDDEWRSVLGKTAWIMSAVDDGGTVVGVLMRRVPAEFSASLSGLNRLREFQFLMFDPKPAWAAIGLPSTAQRLELAREVVELFRLLHGLNVIVGDVSGKNLLWTVSPRPAVMLLDCDALRKVGSHPPTQQLHTPDWDDPHTPSGHATKDSDRYKLSLLLARILARNAYARPGQGRLELLPDIDEQVRSQVELVFNQAAGASGTRPNEEQWRSALSARPAIALNPNLRVRPAPGEGLTGVSMDHEPRPVIPMNRE